MCRKKWIDAVSFHIEQKKVSIFATNEIFCVNLQRKKRVINNKNKRKKEEIKNYKLTT